MTRRVSVMNTAFRDGFQSCVGARVFTPDFLPALEAALDAGFTHFEAGGGARYQVPYLYCGEDAFDMMDTFRATTARRPTSRRSPAAERGGSRQPVQRHHQAARRALQEARHDHHPQLRRAERLAQPRLQREVHHRGRAPARGGGGPKGLPPGVSGGHTPEFYIGVLKDILDNEVPFSSVCFKDASGTTPPQIIYETVKEARKRLGEDVHLRVHSHETAGISVAQYRAALDAGANGIDLSMAPMSGGTAQVDVVTMWQALRGTDFDMGIDIDKVLKAEEVFKECMKDYFLPPESRAVEPLIPFSPMPGGALTANTQMMRDNGMLDKYPAAIREMREVVSLGGFGSSVTPVSQFYFQQALNNAIFGRWKRIAEGYGKMVLGYFGKTPREPDPMVVQLAAGAASSPPPATRASSMTRTTKG